MEQPGPVVSDGALCHMLFLLCHLKEQLTPVTLNDLFVHSFQYGVMEEERVTDHHYVCMLRCLQSLGSG